LASEKQIAANRRNAAKSTGPRTEKGKACLRMNALRHGLAITLPEQEKTWDEINTHSPAQIMKRVRQIERRRVKIMKLIDLLIEKTGRHQLERTVRHLANLDRYSARAHSKLKREVK
jgi:hypothetical protein